MRPSDANGFQERKALEKRDLEIAQKALRYGIRYSDVAREYHLTRERVRQIVARLHPAAYLKKRQERYGRCRKCRRAMTRIDAEPVRRYRLVDPEHRCCRSCNGRMHRRKITLSCHCGKKRKISLGKLLTLISLGRYRSARLSAKCDEGSYVRRACSSSSPRKIKTQGNEIASKSVGGREGRIPGGMRLNHRARGRCKGVRASEESVMGICVSPPRRAAFMDGRRGREAKQIGGMVRYNLHTKRKGGVGFVESVKLKLRNGSAEFEAEGARRFVESRLRSFKPFLNLSDPILTGDIRRRRRTAAKPQPRRNRGRTTVSEYPASAVAHLKAFLEKAGPKGQAAIAVALGLHHTQYFKSRTFTNRDVARAAKAVGVKFTNLPLSLMSASTQGRIQKVKIGTWKIAALARKTD